ncbi:MAG TPA: type II secretion system protein [Candidatus Paceibacterota bacterium]|nr:type II secretion system protein [Candidatus Paceibacterota bacterium]
MTNMNCSTQGFTAKRAERNLFCSKQISEASAGRKAARGFTLLESLIAVTIITLAVAAPLYSASNSTKAIALAQNQLTASFLAQEAVEYIRIVRDDQFLSAYRAGGSSVSTAAWTNFLTSLGSCRNGTCMFDPTRPVGVGSGLALQPCSGMSCTPLYVIPSGMYTEQTGIVGATLTPYTRTVQVADVNGTDELIVSTVTWNFHGTQYSVRVSDHVTPWQ